MNILLSLLWLGNPIPGQDFHAQLNAIHALGTHLTQTEQTRLLDWLGQVDHTPGAATLKNDLLNVLRAQQQPHPKLAQTLASIWHETKHGTTMRDYALQHLAALGDNQTMRTVLLEATHHTDASFAGTALLGLLRKAPSEPQLPDRALALAAQVSAAVETRIPALLVCGQLQLRQVAPLVRDLIQSEAPVSLKLAAVATLGQVGSAEDLQLLEELTHQPGRLALAADRAHASLSQTLNGSARTSI